MNKIIKRLLKIPAIYFMAGIFLFTAKAEAVSPTDYVGMNNLVEYYLERLDNQDRIISDDLEYLEETIEKFDNFNDMVKKLKSAAQRCRERLASGELDVCTVVFRGANISVEEAGIQAKALENRANMCKKCKAEAISDERQLSKRLEEINKIAKDLEAWKEENDKAIYEELKSLAEFAFGELVSYFAKQAEAAKNLMGWYNRYEKQLRSRRVNADIVLQKLQSVYSRYLAAQITAFTGKSLKRADIFTVYRLFVDTVSQIALTESDTNKDVKLVLEDPEVKKLLNEDRPGLEAVDILLQKGAEDILKKKKLWKLVAKQGATKLAPAVGIAVLARDAGYNGTKWWLSLKMIVMRYELAEKSAQAVNSLHNLIERRKVKWAPCL